MSPYLFVGQMLVFLVCLGPSVRAVWRDQRIMSGVIPGWIGQIIWGIIFCVLAPGAFSAVLNNPDVTFLFPEMPGLLAIAVVGWVNAAFFSFLVWIVREVTLFVGAQRIKNQKSKI